MNVYYEDGPLENPPKQCHWIDASRGFRDCDLMLRGCFKESSKQERFKNVYTNFPLVLSKKYLTDIPTCSVFVRSDESWALFEPDNESYNCESSIHQAYKALN